MLGEFAIAEVPIAEAAIGTGPPGPPVLGPGHIFEAEEVKYRYGERYISEASNRKFLGIPRGVYLGFTPTFNGDTLTLTPNASYGVSFARLTSPDDPLYSVDIATTGSITLDFTDHLVFPVNVVLKATGALGVPHTAELVTQAAPATDPSEILICRIPSAQTVAFDDPTNRDSPFAHASAPLSYGFMKDGAAEELLAAIALTAEITAARTDLTGFAHPALDARLTADMTAAAIAGRLGKEIRNIRGDDFLVAAPSSSVNISRSFSKVHRDLISLTPSENIGGFGSEDVEGAITSGTVPVTAPVGSLTDSERNVCAIIDATTEGRLIDSTRQVAFGRLSLVEITLTGTLTFNGTTTVTGAGTLFTVEVSAGDIIQDPSGNFYEVASTPGADTTLTLSTSALVSASSAGLLRRRFEVNARIRTGPSADSAFTIPGGTTVRVFFPTWRTVEDPQFDYLPLLSKNHEAPPVPLATTTASGRSLISPSAPEGKAGAIFAIQQGGGQVGPAHTHTIDFDGVSTGASGVANVTQRGPAGAPGAPGGAGLPGPPGPAGPTGRGYTGTSTLFANSGVCSYGALGSGASYSHTVNFTGISELLFLSGGCSQWLTPAGFSVDSDDHFECVDIVKVTLTQGRLDAKVPTGGSPTGSIRWYLNGTGD